jgi:hypothetical protein
MSETSVFTVGEISPTDGGDTCAARLENAMPPASTSNSAANRRLENASPTSRLRARLRRAKEKGRAEQEHRVTERDLERMQP